MVLSSLEYIPMDGIGSDNTSNFLKNYQTILQSDHTTDVRFKSRCSHKGNNDNNHFLSIYYLL